MFADARQTNQSWPFASAVGFRSVARLAILSNMPIAARTCVLVKLGRVAQPSRGRRGAAARARGAEHVGAGAGGAIPAVPRSFLASPRGARIPACTDAGGRRAVRMWLRVQASRLWTLFTAEWWQARLS